MYYSCSYIASSHTHTCTHAHTHTHTHTLIHTHSHTYTHRVTITIAVYKVASRDSSLLRYNVHALIYQKTQ